MNEEQKQNSLITFTDGSSLGNPGPGGWGAVIISAHLDECIELGGAKPHTTNNEMELTAIVSVLSYAMNNTQPLHVYTDSQYAINGITKWMYGWKNNNWQKKDGEEIKNLKTWQTIYDLVQTRKETAPDITWHHVRGHVGVPGNERVDDIARELAEGKDVEMYRGTLTGYSISNILEIQEVAQEAKKKSHKNTKAHSYLSLIDGIAMRHMTWVECEARVKGQNAKFKKSISEENEIEILEDWGVSL